MNEESQPNVPVINFQKLNSYNLNKESLNPKNNSNNSNSNNSNSPNISMNKIINTELCKKHNKICSSFIWGTNKYLCTECLKGNVSNLKIFPISNFLRETKNKIFSSEIKSDIVRQELSKLKDFFINFKEEFHKSNLEKIEDFFSYIYKLVQYNFNTALNVLNQCNKEQDIQLDTKIKEIDELYEELNLIDQNVTEINKDNDFELCKHEEILTSIHNRVNSFLNYEYELNLLHMDLNLKKDFKENLFYLIQNSYEIDVDYLTVNNEQLNIKHILQKEKYWICICGENENLTADFKCSNCDRYRKLQTLDYFTNNPSDSFEVLKQVINNRRKDESKEFKRLLNESQAQYKNKAMNVNNNVQEKIYFIDIDWFLSWKCYVMNDLSEKTLMNNKKMVFYVKNLGKYF